MRLFIAADLPLELMDALAETSALLREQVKGRYSSPDSFHLTLAFLGETPAGRIPEIEDALERCGASHSPIDVCLGDLGSFGRKREATLWQGFKDPAPLEHLARDLRKDLESIGIPFDNKTPKAHITLMRKADLSQGLLPAPCIARGTITQMTLYQSELLAQGALHTPLHTVSLNPSC